MSAPARQAKLDGNQNHHTIPSNVTSHPLIQNSTQQQQQQQQHSVPSNLSAGNIPSHPVSPTMTTHSSVTTPNITTHVNAAPSPVILTSNAINPGANTTALPVNPRHEVKLNAMPYVSYDTLSLTFTDVTISKSVTFTNFETMGYVKINMDIYESNIFHVLLKKNILLKILYKLKISPFTLTFHMFNVTDGSMEKYLEKRQKDCYDRERTVCS